MAMRQSFKQPARIAMRIVAGGRSHRSNSGMTARTVRGFSFMEVMTAMFVVTVGLVTVIKIFSSGFVNSATDRDRIVAAGLAQEGLEIVKNIKDNALAIPGNANGFSAANGLIGQNHCRVDFSSSSVTCFPNANDPDTHFSLALSGGSYIITGSAQKFSRYIHIDYDAGNQYADVVSVVYWKPEWATDITGPNRILHSGVVQQDNCHAGNKCVLAKMRLEAWKP